MNFPIIMTGPRALAHSDNVKPANQAGHAHKAPLTPTQGPRRFEVDGIYGCRSVCDHNCIFRFRVVKRTEKSVWLQAVQFRSGAYVTDGKITRRKLRMIDGAEACDPHGVYSMSPVLTADKKDTPA